MDSKVISVLPVHRSRIFGVGVWLGAGGADVGLRRRLSKREWTVIVAGMYADGGDGAEST